MLRRTIIIFLGWFTCWFCEAQTMGDYSEHWISGDTLYVRCDTAVVQYLSPRPDILRISFSPDGVPNFAESIVVPETAWNLSGIAVEDLPDDLIITTGNFIITAAKFPFRHSISSDGTELMSQTEDGGYSWDGDRCSSKNVVQTDDHFYGFGEKSIPFDRKGHFFRMYNVWTDHYELDESNMNINIPVFFNPRGYGILFDNTYLHFGDMGYSEYDRWSYTMEGGSWVEYVMTGSLAEMLEAYRWLTGSAPLPPKWCLGFLQSKYGYETQEEALAIADTMRMKDFPCDAICLDLFWYETMGDLAWNTAAWPDPQGMLDELLENGFKTVLIQQPYIWEGSLNFDTALNNGFLGSDSTGAPIIIPDFWGMSNAGLLDITDPEAAEWWWDKHPPLIEQGVAGWWTDLHEPEVHPDTMVHYLGSAAEVHNIFALIWAKNLYEHYRAEYPDQRLYNQTRSGFAGMQRYSVMPWSNDANGTFGGLAAQLPIMLGMSMSGVGINHADIGGFWGNINAELYIRWMQFGCFTPVARAHGWRDDNEPWRYGETAEEVSRRYLKWRYRLMPYLYSLCREYSQTGLPPARPMVLEYPDDPQTYEMSSQYLLGEDILIAPVVQAGQTNKLVYIPEGEWTDFWNEVTYSGPGWFYLPAPLEDIPVLVKEGAVLPLQTDRHYWDQSGQDTIIVRIYPGSSGDFTLYEDDGKSYEYENSAYALTEFTMNSADSQTMLEISGSQGNYTGAPEERTYLCDFRMIQELPAMITIDDVPAAQAPDSSALMNTVQGWCYRSDESDVLVKFARASSEPVNVTIYWEDAPQVENLVISRENEDIILTWEPFPGADHYLVFRSNIPYDFTGAEPVQVTGESYNDLAAVSEQTYFYRIIAVVED